MGPEATSVSSHCHIEVGHVSPALHCRYLADWGLKDTWTGSSWQAEIIDSSMEASK